MSQSELFVSLDIGSSSVKCIIGEVVDQTTIHMIGVGKEKSSGIKKGSIVDIDAAGQSIRKAINQAERMLGISVKKVVVGIPANQVALQKVKGVVAISNDNREITDEDLDRVMESAESMVGAHGHTRVELIPEQFIVDNLPEISDPRGMLGIRLEMDATVATSPDTYLHNIVRCVERTGVEIQQIYLQPHVSGYYALTEDEKSRGTLFIDMGADTTTIGVYKDSRFTNVAMIPIGGENITKDLSIILKTSMEQAEKIKKDYGHAFYDTASDHEMFTVPIIGTDSKEQYSQRFISEIIGARVEEIFDLILDELYAQQVEDLPGGVVITGGVAKLEGLQELATEKLQSSVRLYTPTQIGARDPELSGAVSLIRYAYKDSEFYNDYSEEMSIEVPEQEEPRKERKAKEYDDEEAPPKEGIVGKLKRLVNNLIE